MSKDPPHPDNLSNLRRTLPGLGVGDGRPVQVQEVSAADVERVLNAASVQSQSPSPFPSSPASSTEDDAAFRNGQMAPLGRGTSNPAMPMLRGASDPAMQLLRGGSSPSIPMLRGTSNPAMPMLRMTGTPERSTALRSSETSIPSLPPTPNRLPLVIVGIGALGVVIGIVAWLHPGQPGAGGRSSTDNGSVVSTPAALPTGGSSLAPPVRTVSAAAPVVVVNSVTDTAVREKKERSAVRKPTEEHGGAATGSKPPALPTNSTPVAKTSTPKNAVAKVESKSSREPQLELTMVPQLTREIMRQHMTVAEPKWQSCPKDGSGKNLSIGISVAPSGSVVKAEVMGPAGSTQTAQCVTARIRNMRFPAYQEGGPKNFFWSYQVP